MTQLPDDAPLRDRRVLVPGGTGGVGEGVVRRYLAAGANVVVPTRSAARQAEFRAALGDAATDRLHVVVHDYSTFAGAEDLAGQMQERLGGIDDVVAAIGGWWSGRKLPQISQADWQAAFVDLATTHAAVMRACTPRMSAAGQYSIVVGASASWPVPLSGLVSMEQAALLMMHRVLAAELDDRRVFALVLGQVRTRDVDHVDPDWITADQVGAVAVAASIDTDLTSRQIELPNAASAEAALAALRI